MQINLKTIGASLAVLLFVGDNLADFGSSRIIFGELSDFGKSSGTLQTL